MPARPGTSYTTTEADLGVTLRVYVTATNAGGSTTAFSDHTFPTIPAPRFAPSVTYAADRDGSRRGRSHACRDAGNVGGFAPIRYVSTWQRCDATVTVCKAVKSVKGMNYKLGSADIGYRIRLSVVAVNPIGSLRAPSEATESIILGPPKPKGRKVVGTSAHDYVPGGGGDDVLSGLAGHDTLMGGKGDDKITGGAGNDYVDAGGGVDNVDSGDGSDTVLVADGETDTVECGEGNDRVIADASDQLSGCEAVSFPATTPTPTPTTDEARSSASASPRGGSPQPGEPPRNPATRMRERVVDLGRCGCAVPAFAMADEHVLGAETPQRPGREEAQERMDADRLRPRAIEGDRPERIRADEDPPLRPPERHLLPEPPRGDREEGERRLGQRARGRRDAARRASRRTPRSRGRAGPGAGSPRPARRARGRAPRCPSASIGSISQTRPSTASACAVLPQPRVLDPAEAALDLVDPAHRGRLTGSGIAKRPHQIAL